MKNADTARDLARGCKTYDALINGIEKALDEKDQAWLDWLARSPLRSPTNGAVRDRVKEVLGAALGTTTMTVDRFERIVEGLSQVFAHDPT